MLTSTPCTSTSAIAPPLPPAAVTVSSWSGLARIRDEGVNVVVMPRRLEARLLRAIEAVAARRPGFGLELGADVRTLPPSIFGPLDHITAPLHVEVRRLVDIFRLTLGWGPVGVRVATTERPMCPRFHVDHVEARLVCTWKGPGTEFLAEDDVLRSMLGRPVPPELTWPAGLRCAEAPIQHGPTGAVVLLKGEAWEGNAGRGAVHRSPAVEAADAPRLVVTIDALFSCAARRASPAVGH